MKNEKNAVWSFFASVKLALFVLIILAVTSIIGTVIPQGKPIEFYAQAFGPGAAKLFQLLNIPDMYHSFWFLSFLVLFSINLIVCSLDRIPGVWRTVAMDNLDMELERIEKMRDRRIFSSQSAVPDLADALRPVLAGAGWKATERERDGGLLFFRQKGAWTRLGVYMVHVSILIIFIGAIIGLKWGWKGSVLIAEGSSTPVAYLNDDNHTAQKLGFEVRCDNFSITYYDSGAPKEFRSDVTVLENGQKVMGKVLIVNDPLTYKGITFYQSSYQPVESQYAVSITNDASGANQRFIIVPQKERPWSSEGITFGILSQQGPGFRGEFRHKVWFSDGKGEAAQFWVDDGGTVKVTRPQATYTFAIKPRFATGLQVAKDPGVWWVYAGCILMLLGLTVVFFLTHRRVWIFLSPTEKGSRMLLSGTSNKNKQGFEQDMARLAASLTADDRLNIVKE